MNLDVQKEVTNKKKTKRDETFNGGSYKQQISNILTN
jgi:hypothetical protein